MGLAGIDNLRPRAKDGDLPPWPPCPAHIKDAICGTVDTHAADALKAAGIPPLLQSPDAPPSWRGVPMGDSRIPVPPTEREAMGLTTV